MSSRRRVSRRILVTAAIASLRTEQIHCWQKWDYSSYSTADWIELWSIADGPGERRGHSLVLFNESKVILFGGRGNDAHRPHIPKRYNVVEEEGVLAFSTYDGMPLSPNYSSDSQKCQPIETCTPLLNASSGNEEACSYSWDHLLHDNPTTSEHTRIEEECGFVPVGAWYNDVWMYDTDCLRYADLACANDGWRILHPGMIFGGCTNENGEHTCETPSERYGHGATMLDATTMAVYGGYSHECEDYCDDFWLFDLISLQWTKEDSSFNSPGERWEFSMISDSNSNIYLFGGHRLWHGFSSDNNVENRWRSRELLTEGGYLDDLWEYGTTQTNEDTKDWTKLERKPTCVDAPGLTWESRNDKHCEIHWPKPRSGHAAVYDIKRNGIWVHGGYSTYFPYPTSNDSGSGFGVQKLGRNNVPIHPTYSFYLEDLWFYDIDAGLWEKKRICELKNANNQLNIKQCWDLASLFYFQKNLQLGENLISVWITHYHCLETQL